MRLSRLYLWVIAASVVVGIVLLLNAYFDVVFLPDAGVFIGVLSMVLFYAVVGLGCAAAYENGKAPGLMRSGMIVGLIALACGVIITFTPELQETLAPAKALMCLIIWPCLMMLSGLLLLLPMRSGWRWGLRATTLALLAGLALFIAGGYVFYPEVPGYWDDEAWERAWRYEERVYPIGVALGLLAGGSLAITLLVGITTALTGLNAPAAPIIRTSYWLQCPRCGCEQEAMTGDHHCTACNLRTKVEFT